MDPDPDPDPDPDGVRHGARGTVCVRTGQPPEISPRPGDAGVRVVDPVGDVRLALLTREPVDPTPCDTGRFRAPVGAAATLDASHVETPASVEVRIRTEDGEFVTGQEEGGLALPPGRYEVELATGRLQGYLAVDGGVEVTTTDDGGVRVDVSGTDRVHVGARSLHRGGEDGVPSLDEDVVSPDDADSIEHVYVGEGVPVGANKMTVDAYYRRLEYDPTADPSIRVAVVCNEPEMAAENVVSDLYGDRDWLDFDVSLYSSLGTDEVRDLLASNVDFLHYVGHVDGTGIRCADGVLDAATLDGVGVDTFLLNACTSYSQGRALVDRGAVAGIVTVADVLDRAASEVGQHVARLLNQGFSMAAALDIVTGHEPAGHRYVVVGDASASLVTNESGTPHSLSVREAGDDTYEVELYGYPSSKMGMGTMHQTLIERRDTRYLNSGRLNTFEVPGDELRRFLSKQNNPVEYRSKLRWATDPALLAEFE